MQEKVALVLPGIDLKDTNKGHEIDKADYIIRLHDSRIVNIEDQGSRYDYGVLPGPWLKRACSQIIKLPKKEWLVYNWAYQKNKTPAPFSIKEIPVNSFYSKMTEKEFSSFLAPSRGLMAIEMCLYFFPDSQLKVYGAEGLKTGQATFYYTGKKCKNNPRHNFQLEFKLINKLWKNKIIWG